MTHIIDLSMPVIADHFRWPAPRQVTGDHSDAAPFQVTKLTLSVHSFTHVDARRHMLPGAPTIEATALEDVAGPAFVADLTDVVPNTEISADRMERALAGYDGEPIILLKSAWDTQRDWKTPEFWREAPYLGRPATEVIAALKPKAVAFDFPQDYTIRLSLDRVVPPMPEHVTHDILLRNGVTLIEYLVNVASVPGPRTFLCALPLKIDGADGAPARVVAIEGVV
ncbi:cyclase family protein [Acuticoccus sp. M5D2P5]|uniref:cyclase family protein n=1 Tax=Acuticoccus kalidii TaxID=2910977 RepID=UPI001F2E2A8D|nr:cyclase family protein [Acuticoccus kalidii]MCF3934598.1 cyclase family protein [Acuticoccus kalidii]